MERPLLVRGGDFFLLLSGSYHSKRRTEGGNDKKSEKDKKVKARENVTYIYFPTNALSFGSSVRLMSARSGNWHATNFRTHATKIHFLV